MKQAATDKVLIVGPSWVGDMVMAQSLFSYLCDSRPGITIDVLAPAWSEAILGRMPEVRRAIEMPVGHGKLQLASRYQIARRLAREDYQQAILLPNSLKSALIPLLAGIPLRTGWRGEFRYGLLNDLRVLDKTALPLMVQRFLALAELEGCPPTSIPTPKLAVDSAAAQLCKEKFNLDADKNILALCPGAEFGTAKQWPVGHYAQLARHYIDRGWQVMLLGSENDSAVTSYITSELQSAQSCIDLAGRTQLGEVVDLLSLASAVVSNDSGLMHIAAALDRPLVAIYGATSPSFTPPLSSAASAAQIVDLDCSPCFQRECPLQHHRCMRELEPDKIITMIDKRLSNTGV